MRTNYFPHVNFSFVRMDKTVYKNRKQNVLNCNIIKQQNEKIYFFDLFNRKQKI